MILVGEIRDRATAEVAFQASLTGHLVLSTFHAGSAAEAVGRLADMGIEPYVLRSGLLAVINQRLARRLCGFAEPATTRPRPWGCRWAAFVCPPAVRLAAAPATRAGCCWSRC